MRFKRRNHSETINLAKQSKLPFCTFMHPASRFKYTPVLGTIFILHTDLIVRFGSCLTQLRHIKCSMNTVFDKTYPNMSARFQIRNFVEIQNIFELMEIYCLQFKISYKAYNIPIAIFTILCFNSYFIKYSYPFPKGCITWL